MSVGLQVWSQTASNNSTSDTNINWAEGMAPSQVNDSARATMASMAKWRDDNNGTIVTAGTTVAFTATTSQVEAALTAGYTITIQFNATADTSATLAVDGLAAKPLQIVAGTNLQGGEFTAGDICRFTYSTTGTGQWIANSAPGYIQNTNQLAAATVTYAKIQNVAASRLLGNPTGSPAAPSEISLGTNLSFSGTVLNAGNTTPVITTITSTATTTWQSTTNAAGAFPLYLRVRMVGSGGGGGGSSAGNGSSGTDTTFNNWVAGGATGGNGNSQVGGSGGTGGANGTGTLITRITGAGGAPSNNGIGGLGANSAFGGGGKTGASGVAGTAGSANSGAGGGGGSGGSNAGSGGGAGEFVEFIVTSPSTAYTVVLGPGGAAGVGATNGGAGAAGRIEVVAYWQ